MKRTIINFYEKNYSQNVIEEELNEIFTYNTRLYEAATVQTLAIWGGNRGFKDAILNNSALELATSMRLAFGEADIIDTFNDEYDVNMLGLLKLSNNELLKRRDKYDLYKIIIKNLDIILFERFKTLHPLGFSLYKTGRKEVEKGQEEDIRVYFHYLKNELEEIRNLYSEKGDIMKLLEKKLGIMGKYTAYITYLESGGNNDDIKEVLGNFYMNAGVLLQFWVNDVKKLLIDLQKLATNPIITFSICKYKNMTKINKKNVFYLLKNDPKLLSRMAEPYEREMNIALKEIKKHKYDIRTHKGLSHMVKNVAKKEQTNLYKKIKGEI